jgi:hypothetical protein
MNRKLIFAFITMVAATFSSCDNKGAKNGQLDTDVVENPASASGEEGDLPVITFESTTHDFGTIKEGEKIAYSFKFKNDGEADLLITNARGSCGCTVPQYPKMPIKPGDSGVIDVTFDSHGKSGHQNKQVTIVANTVPNTTIINITGEVIASEVQTK